MISIVKFTIRSFNSWRPSSSLSVSTFWITVSLRVDFTNKGKLNMIKLYYISALLKRGWKPKIYAMNSGGLGRRRFVSWNIRSFEKEWLNLRHWDQTWRSLIDLSTKISCCGLLAVDSVELINGYEKDFL